MWSVSENISYRNRDRSGGSVGGYIADKVMRAEVAMGYNNDYVIANGSIRSWSNNEITSRCKGLLE
jgi:hypothetical protein